MPDFVSHFEALSDLFAKGLFFRSSSSTLALDFSDLMFLSSCVSDVTVWGIRWDLSSKACSVTEYNNKLPDKDYALLGASFSIEDAKDFLSCSPTLKIIKITRL